ncbi:MAG: histidinol dehydrogenase, partial [Anaerolineales bacterium]
MLSIYSPDEARNSILKRIPLDQMEVSEYVKASIKEIFGMALKPNDAVRIILQEIRANGDKALRKWSEKIDGLERNDFRVSSDVINHALGELGNEEREALSLSANRIKDFYTHQPVHSWIKQDSDGTLGQLVRPIRRIGIYVPGGTAPLPSTVLMSVVPAQVAGVSEIGLVVPPDRVTGRIAPVTLATAGVLGIDEIYALGGAQAIAAMAFGTESIPKVDKIFGPGNLFVTLAKQQVFGTVGIDGLAGPTETMIIADGSANPSWVAADLLAQAEHDVLASAILLTWDQTLAKAVQSAVNKQLGILPRSEIILQSLENRSGIVLTESLQQSIDIANIYGPEHLCLSIRDAFQTS